MLSDIDMLRRYERKLNRLTAGLNSSLDDRGGGGLSCNLSLNSQCLPPFLLHHDASAIASAISLTTALAFIRYYDAHKAYGILPYGRQELFAIERLRAYSYMLDRLNSNSHAIANAARIKGTNTSRLEAEQLTLLSSMMSRYE